MNFGSATLQGWDEAVPGYEITRIFFKTKGFDPSNLSVDPNTDRESCRQEGVGHLRSPTDAYLGSAGLKTWS